MGRGRFVVAVFVALCLAVPPIADEAHAAETTVDCGFEENVITHGFDGAREVATYTVHAKWCIETTYETRTFTESSSGDELSSSSDEAKVDKAKKKQKAKKGRRGKRARRRSRRGGGGDGGGSSGPRTRTERRVVSECITDFQLDAIPKTLVRGADLIGVTTTPVGSDSQCSTRSYRVVGRFGRDYIAGVPGVTRSVLSPKVGGLTFESYPLGKFGHFDITVSFARDGGATCQGCLPSFAFCDVRIVSSDGDASCVHL